MIRFHMANALFFIGFAKCDSQLNSGQLAPPVCCLRFLEENTMKVQNITAAALLAAGLATCTAAWAHTPLCNCYDNGDGTVECEGGFSDGSSAAGVAMKVMDASGKVVLQGKMDKSSTYSFKKPAGNYSVMFDAGEGHRITIPSSKISK